MQQIQFRVLGYARTGESLETPQNLEHPFSILQLCRRGFRSAGSLAL
jgi:hypothetical protein